MYNCSEGYLDLFSVERKYYTLVLRGVLFFKQMKGWPFPQRAPSNSGNKKTRKKVQRGCLLSAPPFFFTKQTPQSPVLTLPHMARFRNSEAKMDLDKVAVKRKQLFFDQKATRPSCPVSPFDSKNFICAYLCLNWLLFWLRKQKCHFNTSPKTRGVKIKHQVLTVLVGTSVYNHY